ncbi:MAG: WecB/TagA/CpsF family glycosyltransferase [Desulfatirhabdiaceae bacterium]
MIPERDIITLLGIPIDNLTRREAVDSVFAMIEAYQTDFRPRYVATVNVDFLVNTLGWLPSDIRHPELLEILRRADRITPDGMPLVWASKLLGHALKERVTGADLVPELAREAALRGKRLFFLGGRDDVGQRAADLMQTRYPGLRVAGVYSPFVHVTGHQLMDADLDDQDIVSRINESRADILLIAFGNPKQEVWFERNRNHLCVPVSIGVGGTFEFIIGTVARAPIWMQKAGLEWLFRISQDPKRLWKRYVVGFYKFGFVIFPVVLYYRYRSWYQKLFSPTGSADTITVKPETFLSNERSHLLIPHSLDAATTPEFRKHAKDIMRDNRELVLDFSRVRFIDSSGMGFLVSLRLTANDSGKKLIFANLTPVVLRFFKVNRLLDLFQKNMMEYDVPDNPSSDDSSLSKPFYYTVQSDRMHVVWSLFGELDSEQRESVNLEGILKKIDSRPCIMDGNGLHFVDSSGLMILMKLNRFLKEQGQTLILCNLQSSVRQMLKIARVDKLFTIASDLDAAIQLAGRPNDSDDSSA